VADPAVWGVAPGYEDYDHQWRDAPPSTVQAVLEAMGAGGAGPPEPRAWVVTAGSPVDAEGPWALETEDGGGDQGAGLLPPDTPLGYHVLRRPGRPAVRLVVSPGRCWLPDGLSAWGWAAQLYAARSRESWGIGDLADLRRLGSWAASSGAGMALVSPLHASVVGAPQQPSPYFPSSRCFRNPIYLRVEEAPGAAEARLDLIALSAQGKALNADRRIDRDAVWALKLAALERLWERFGGDPAFDRYCDDEGPALAAYATWCAMAEEQRRPWTEWPAGLRSPDSAETLAFVDGNRRRIRFHQWLQWLLDRQLYEAGAEIDLVHDLAVGVDPGGADAWLWQGCFATGMRVGAPPDEFNVDGQDWGVPPFDPWKLRAAAYEPFIRMVRAGMRHAGGLRLDHVMGLFRLFWVPPDREPAEGAYVAYPWQDLLRIVALESHRARAYVVGEDLGTVEDSTRERLAAAAVLSYRLLWFEESPPSEFPVDALAAVTTHDLPTVAGLWGGADGASMAAARERLREWGDLSPGASAAEAVEAAYRLLAAAPSRLVTATLEDALLVEERPNIPGAADRPNWSVALPKPLEELEVNNCAAAIARALSRRASS
jgi:4-alpha-glucanotransferase